MLYKNRSPFANWNSARLIRKSRRSRQGTRRASLGCALRIRLAHELAAALASRQVAGGGSTPGFTGSPSESDQVRHAGRARWLRVAASVLQASPAPLPKPTSARLLAALPSLASGGIVRRPTLAVVGDRSDGRPEVISALPRDGSNWRRNDGQHPRRCLRSGRVRFCRQGDRSFETPRPCGGGMIGTRLTFKEAE